MHHRLFPPAFVAQKTIHVVSLEDLDCLFLMNNLSRILRLSDSATSFKAALKAHLFNKYFKKLSPPLFFFTAVPISPADA